MANMRARLTHLCSKIVGTNGMDDLMSSGKIVYISVKMCEL